VLEVRIRDGRSAEGATLVRVADFEGPLGLLLALIESRRLDVLTVPLGALAGAYLEALAAVPAERLAHVSAPSIEAVAGIGGSGRRDSSIVTVSSFLPR